jgi:mRNA-degrading endonuclease HigB of HigAB toxin-antitoxin module
MRLIGVPVLFELFQRADPMLNGAILALHAELEAAHWSRAEEVLAAYPNAVLKGRRLVVELDPRHRAKLSINYEMGIIMIEFAGCGKDSTTASRLSTGSRE